MPIIKTIHTAYGLAAIEQAQDSGTKINLLQIAVGDGGGLPADPSESQTALVNEVYRASVRRVETVAGSPLSVYADFEIPASVGGFVIREAGLVDEHGEFFVISSLADVTKPLGTDPGAMALKVVIRFQMPVAGLIAPQAPLPVAFPTTGRPMGIPAPATPLTAGKDAGTWTGDSVTFFYVYTYVNDWGWESAPSPPSTQHDRESDATTTLSAFAAAPAGNYGINRIRIYRTQTGESGATEFFFLREIAYGVTSTQDATVSVSNNEVIRTVNTSVQGSAWLPPPEDLHHLTPMWNGMAAGIVGNSVRFCEAYVLYAWPIAYDAIPPDSKPVALGVAGQNLLVLTNGRPMVLSGTSPDSMDQMPLEFSQGCIAPESVASMGAGVAWASNDGLCWWGPSTGPRLLTAGLMTRDQWQALNPASMVGQMYEGLYLASYDDGKGRKAFMIDPGNPTGLYFMDSGHEAMHFDELQDQLYVLTGGNVQRFDAAATFMTARARSKEYRLPTPENMGWMEVTADTYPVTVFVDCMNIPAGEVTKLIAMQPLLTAPTPTSVRYTATAQDRSPVPLPGGWLPDDYQFEVSTSGEVQGIAFASSMEELART